eukprot:3259008-Amphidinium_carterae.1
MDDGMVPSYTTASPYTPGHYETKTLHTERYSQTNHLSEPSQNIHLFPGTQRTNIGCIANQMEAQKQNYVIPLVGV